MLPPCDNFRKLGLLRPRIGSIILRVLDNRLDLTMQTNTLPRHKPTLKNEVGDDIFLARFKPARGSMGFNASSGIVKTVRSEGTRRSLGKQRPLTT